MNNALFKLTYDVSDILSVKLIGLHITINLSYRELLLANQSLAKPERKCNTAITATKLEALLIRCLANTTSLSFFQEHIPKLPKN